MVQQKTVACCAALIGAALSGAQPAAGEDFRAIDSLIAPFVDAGMFDGAVLVDRGGTIVYERSFGRASHEFGIEHDRQTRFRIASVSKDLTDAALGALIERGVLTLDTRVAAYLPDFPGADRITVRHIIEFSSGIPHTNEQSWGHGDIAVSREELLARLAALPLDFEPGTDRRYSNGGYAVLAYMIGAAAGSDYSTAMRDLVFEPLRMTDSGDILNSRDVIEQMAVGYEPGPEAGKPRHPRPYAVETRPGGGSLYSTARDLRKFYRAILENKLFNSEIRQQLFHLDDAPLETTGRSPGFSSQILANKEADSITIIVSNNYAFAQGLADEISRLADGKKRTWPAIKLSHTPIKPDDPRLGRYRWPDFIDAQGDIEIASDGGLAFVDEENDYASALLPLDDGSLLFTMYYFVCANPDDDTRDLVCTPIGADARSGLRLTRIGD